MNVKEVPRHLSLPRGLQSYLTLTFCIIVLSTLASAYPSRSPNTCGEVRCRAATEDDRNFKFHYKRGSSYNYLYTVNSTIYVEGGPADKSGIHFSANTTIHFLTECDAVLFMKDVVLWHSVQKEKPNFSQAQTSKDFKKSLEQFPLRFSYDDGIIAELCPEVDEAAWVLNIKRGLLSSFQNSMRRLDLEHRSHENDVNGNCKVDYRIGQATSSTLTIERIKDLNSCGDKYGIFSSIQGVPYNFGPLQQSMPAIESLSECSQVVDRNLIVEVQCMEKHRLKPLSSETSGVQVSITQHLDLIAAYTARNTTFDESQDKAETDDDDMFGLGLDDDEDEEDETKLSENQNPKFEDAGTFLIIYEPDPYISEITNRTIAEVSRRETLRFKHEYHVAATGSSDYNRARNTLQKFCGAVKTNVEANAGSLFEDLVHALRGLTSADMMHLSRESSNLCDGQRSLFDNVLEAVGTAASVTVMKDRISSGDAPKETITSWINSLTFVPKPDLNLLNAAFPILRARDNFPNVLLSYSALVHTYCRQNSNCSQQQPVQILNRLYEKFFNLTGCVTKHRKNVEQVLMYLKGMGNFGMYDEGIHSALQTCINTNERSEIRVAAIEAYRRMSCSEVAKGHEALKTIFANMDEDAEVRIAAFLTIMKCPSYSTIRWLKKIMETEEIRQVTSFVSSFVRNLKESSLPSKLELQGLVSDETFKDPFNTDFRQFSKNFEASAFYPEGNFGVALESNVIFSQRSYLPRSTSLNLTMDLFGESVNVFEATIRTESLEHYVETIFGPNGKLRGSGLHNLLSTLKRREKRAVPSKRKLKTLALDYDAMKRYYSDPIVSVSVRSLGNEIAFFRKVGLEEQVQSLRNLNPMEFLEKLTNTKDSSWQKSSMLFDSSYIIPTGIGLPLNLSAQASNIIRFQMESLIDASNFRVDPFQLKLKGKLIPSALVTASATVSMSAFKSHAGMKVRAQLRSSAALEGSLEMEGTRLLDVQLGMPKSQLELLEFRSELLFLEKDEFQLTDKALKLKEDCSTGLLYKYLGLKICTRSRFPILPRINSNDDYVEDHPTLMSSLPFLINGPSQYALTVEKSNSNLLKSRFHYQWSNNETGTEFILKTVRTTGTVTNPKEDELGINYNFDKENKKFDLSVNIPGSTAILQAQLKDEKVSLNMELTEKLSRRPFMKTSFQLDRVEFMGSGEDVEKSSKSYTGTGEVTYKDWRMDLSFDGSEASDKFHGTCNGRYLTRSGRSESISFALSSTTEERKKLGHVLSVSSEMQLSFELTQYPDYNSVGVWKSKLSEDGYQNDIDFRHGRNHLKENDPSTFHIKGSAHHESNHEKTRVKWMFFATQPSQQIDWGAEASFSTQGKSFDAAISIRYAPDKAYGTSFVLKRKPGMMLFLDSAWNVTIPNSPPMKMTLYINEEAARVYQIAYKLDWFSANNLALDIMLSDRSRRNKVDSSCSVTISTNTISDLKVGAHYLAEEKETKLQMSSEYQNKRNAFEVGHIRSGGRKHKLYGSVTAGESVYLIMSELDFEYGAQCSLLTDLGPSFPNVEVRVKATNQNGLRMLSLDYTWDKSSELNKRFLFEVSLDSSKPNFHWFEGIVQYPGYSYFCEGHYSLDIDDGSRILIGRVKWKDEDHLQFNAKLFPQPSKENAYFVHAEVFTPFEPLKNVSLNVGIEFRNERMQCLLDLDGAWGENQNLKALIDSKLEDLEENQESEETEDGSSKSSLIPFRYTFLANVTSTVEELSSISVSLHHVQFATLNCKTDLDIKLANDKEISLTNHLVLPDSFSDLLSTRVELHIKTPFDGFQNIDMRVILGRKEDKDVMALIGIYMENLQYSISISGTPRFEEDGALSFEIATSNSNYDKIFGSFSYAIGDNSRLACQIGWPQVVIGLEAGAESSGWNELFQVYLSFTSPWMPVKKFNVLAKIDRAQLAEIKLELNEDGINAKSEWVVESWTSFDIRLDGSSPFKGAEIFGGVLKNSWDEPENYHSQILGWIDTQQIGYKLEGGTSEKEEECGFVSFRHVTLELDTLIYPTVRTNVNLSSMDINYKLDATVVLKEGPISMMVELEALDVLRFHEKISITTPYPSLFQLNVNLDPGIVTDIDLYNFVAHAEWRSGSQWDEAGIVIRYGPQDRYEVLVTEDMENKAFLECTPTDDSDVDKTDYDFDPVGNSGVTIDLPKSQLLHFHSPLNWAKVVKLEYEPISINADDEDRFPIRKFAMVYQASNASLSAVLQNEALNQKLTAIIDTGMILEERISHEIDCSLDLTEDEKKLNIRSISHHPVQSQYSLMSQWNNQLPKYFTGNMEIGTPIEKLEQQTASLIYAHNEDESSYTMDLEVTSVTFEKFATNVVLGPKHFSMTLNTPIENYGEIDVRADSKYSDNAPDNSLLETVVRMKNGDSEIEIDLETTVGDEGSPHIIKGTISATFAASAHPQGELEGQIQRNSEGGTISSTGNVDWKNGENAKAALEIHLPLEDRILPTFNVVINTTFDGLEHWKIICDTPETNNEYNVIAKIPFEPLSDITARIIIEKGNSWLHMKTLKVQGYAPAISLSTDATWFLEKWNNFEVTANGKYSARIEEMKKISESFADTIPSSNSFVFSFGNQIPTLSTLTTLDSKLKLKIQEPDLRVGQHFQIRLDSSQTPAFTFESSTVSTDDYTHVNATADFDESFDKFDGSMKYKTSGSNDRIYQVGCKWVKDEATLDGEAEIVWGSEAMGTVTIQSIFNGSISDNSDRKLHVLVASAIPSEIPGSESQEKTKNDKDEEKMEGTDETPNPFDRPFDNPLISLDGNFNKESGVYSTRIRFGQNGLDEPPVVTDWQLYFKGLDNFDSTVLFTSGIENFTDIKLQIGHKIQKNEFNGSYGGHWDGDEAMLKYFLEYEILENLIFFNVSLFGVIPVSTESVPKPQRAGLDVHYKGEILNSETGFRGEYNGVQLIKTIYKTNSLSAAGLDRDNTQLELDNHFWPLGFNHTYQYTYSGGKDGSNFPTKLAHYLDIYRLRDPDLSRFEGELEIHTNSSGELISLRGNHPSRKVYFITDYNFNDDRQFHHSTKLSWKSESWLGYELSLMNMTNEAAIDHRLALKIAYPIRSIHVDSGYTVEGNTFKLKTDLNLNASRTEEKISSLVISSLEQMSESDMITAKTVVTLKHPLILHDIIAAGELSATVSALGKGKLDSILSVEYSDDSTQRMTLNWNSKADVQDVVKAISEVVTFTQIPTTLPYWELETTGKLEHSATNLELNALCSTQHSPKEIFLKAWTDFKNSAKPEKQESRIHAKLLKDLTQALLELNDPEGHANFYGRISGQYPYFVANGECNVSGIQPNPVANVALDMVKPYIKLYAVYGEGLHDGLFSEGGVVDSRNVFFDISESYDNFRFSDVNFYLRLNHSRLITSKLKWRPELYSEVKEALANLYGNLTVQSGVKWNRIMMALKEDATKSGQDIWEQMRPNLEPFLDALQKDTNFTTDYEAFRIFLVDTYENNEFHARDIHDYVQLLAEEISAKLKSAFERGRRELGNPSQLLQKALTWIADQFQKFYKHLDNLWRNYMTYGGDGIKQSLTKLKQLFYLYLNDAMELAEELIVQLYQSLSNFAGVVYMHISRIVEEYRPVVMGYLHQIETAVYSVVTKILDFFYEARDAVMQSPYYDKLTKLAEDLDTIYKDISRNDVETNIRKYGRFVKDFVRTKISELKELNLSFGKIGKWLEAGVKRVMEMEVVKDILGAASSLVNSGMYAVQYTELDVIVSKFLLTLMSKGHSIFFMTAIETASTFEQAKTKFYFEPSKGIVYLEQKLPMPVAAFNETPNFKELPEYKAVINAQDFFQGAEESAWDAYNKMLRNPANLIPPYDGHAMIVGNTHFFTFDGFAYKHKPNCVHLLAADLVDGNFSVSLKMDDDGSPNIVVSSGHNILTIDMSYGIRDPKRGSKQNVSLPVQLANLQGYREANKLIVESPKGLTVSCDIWNSICLVKISGWYSRKVAGVLGTMDMEPSTDLITSTGERSKDISKVFQSWDVSDDSSGICTIDSVVLGKTSISNEDSSPAIKSACTKIFMSKSSPLEPCFTSVQVDPYLKLCLDEERSSTTPYCTAAIAYMHQCRQLGVKTKAPSACIQCMIEDEVMMEGDAKVISSPPPGSPKILSTDVVFIIEAKDCNRALRTRRKLDTIVTALEDEFTKKGFQNNRYAAVVYGGDGVFDKPHPIVQNNEIFTSPQNFEGIMMGISIGNGNNDTFGAIWYALHNLEFRPGAKTFILIPCSNCNPLDMTVDFSSLHYAMLEQDAKLHVLTSKDFLFDAKNLAKKFFGYDAKLGYTKSDGLKNRLKGDAKIRHQVFLPRKNLGYCAPLALETNGTVFSMKKLQNRREKVVKLFTTVFSRRVVSRATPAECQTCYCVPNERTGLGKVDCFVCSYPRYKPLPDHYDENLSLDHITPEVSGNQFEDGEEIGDTYDDNTAFDDDDD